MSIANGSEAGTDSLPTWRQNWQRRLLLPLRGLLDNGLTRRRLAWALAVGALVGSMPLAWGTSLLCLGSALLFGLNPVAVQVGNFAAWPLQFFLAYPYLRLGSAWFRPAAAASPTGNLLQTLALANGAALGAWAVTAPLFLPLFYATSRLLLATLSKGSDINLPSSTAEKKCPDARRPPA